MRRIRTFIAVALLSIALLGVSSVSNGALKLGSNLQKADDNYLHLGTPVEIFKCTQCHKSLDRVDYPNVKIPHNVHLDKGIQCQSCHNEYPHEPGKINKPSMATCFNCHGSTHGKQGKVAPTACNVCHPKNFNLMPADHKTPWQKWKTKTDCIFCHEQKFCTKCHDSEEQAVKARMKFTPPTTAISAFSGETIKIDDPVKMNNCSPCHNNWDRTEYPLVRFYHTKHFEKGIKCAVCHTEFPHKDGKIERPEMKACMSCHGTDHNKQGEVASSECLKCHKPNFNQKPASHDNKWVRQEPFNHTAEAKKDRGYCLSCHQESFCDSCHGMKPLPHNSDWKQVHGKKVVGLWTEKDKTTDPKDLVCARCHEATQFCASCHKGVFFPHSSMWRKQHGKQAVKTQRASCYTCHNQSLCENCHKGIEMPHKSSWIDIHRSYVKDPNNHQKCLNCHTGERSCERCHSAHQIKDKQGVYDYPIPGILR